MVFSDKFDCKSARNGLLSPPEGAGNPTGEGVVDVAVAALVNPAAKSTLASLGSGGGGGGVDGEKGGE